MSYRTAIDGCGVFGVLRLSDTEPVGFHQALDGIEAIRFRGSRLGAGFAEVNLDPGNHFVVKSFVDGPATLGLVRDGLASCRGLELVDEKIPDFDHPAPFKVWTGYVNGSHDELWDAVSNVNSELLQPPIRGRIYSYGRHLNVYKGVGYPSEVAEEQGLTEGDRKADLWLAHTRQPTNSPGSLPIWSHPFACFDFGVVHNGDISSFGSNMEFLRSRGVKSFVGTDSEVIVYLLDQLVRVEGLSLEEAALVLTRPYDAKLGELDGRLRKLISDYRGASMDGPFTALVGYCDGRDTYMMAITDRSRFRPIVVGEENGYVYAASEECAIRTVAPRARVYSPEPGGFFLASMKHGVIQHGREHLDCYHSPPEISKTPGPAIDAWGRGYEELNRLISDAIKTGRTEITLRNVNGQRYIGVNLPQGTRITVEGTAGNCLANFNEGAEVLVYGNAEDDVGDAMQSGRVVIHGDAREVVGQALQGGEIFVRGSIGNRGAIQMREYMDSRPFLIVGNKADNWLGEYMAGGVVMVLGLQSLQNGCDCRVVGDYLATGMVGGMIYVRGSVESSQIGLPPLREDLLMYLEGLRDEGLMNEEEYRRCLNCRNLDPAYLERNLNPAALKRVRRLYQGKYTHNLSVEHRRLNEEDMAMVEGRLKSFFREFGLDEGLYRMLLNSEFTVIGVGKTRSPADRARIGSLKTRPSP